MPQWSQHLLALTLAAACLSYVVWQAFASLRGKRSKLGSCCSKGCQPPVVADPKVEKVIFFPSDMLRKRP